MSTPSKPLQNFIRARISKEEPSGLFLTLLLLVLISAALVFGAIAEDVINGDPLTITDLRFSDWLHGHSIGWLTRIMIVLTHTHSTVGVTIMTLAVCAYLWSKSKRVGVLIVVLSVFGGMLLNATLKQIFMRARPHLENPLIVLNSYSFPSGHTMMATVFYGSLCFLFVTRVRDWRARGAAFTLCASLILLVGFSRIYLGVHYLSDVLAAIAEGLAWLTFCLISVEELRRRRKRNRQPEGSEPGT